MLLSLRTASTAPPFAPLAALVTYILNSPIIRQIVEPSKLWLKLNDITEEKSTASIRFLTIHSLDSVTNLPNVTRQT